MGNDLKFNERNTTTIIDYSDDAVRNDFPNLCKLEEYIGRSEDNKTESCIKEYVAQKNEGSSAQAPIEITAEEPFELRQIPEIMREIYGWHKASELQDIWFNGAKYIITLEQKQARELIVNEKFEYKEEFYVRDSNVLLEFFTIAWSYKESDLVRKAFYALLSHHESMNGNEFAPIKTIDLNITDEELSQAKLTYDHTRFDTTKVKLMNNKATRLIHKRFTTENRYNFPDGDHDLFQVIQERYKDKSNKLIRQIFHNMNFQHVRIGQDTIDYVSETLEYVFLNAMDEFYATVGPSSLYAVVGKYYKDEVTIQIKSVYLYIRDTLDFMNDETGSVKDSDQYLGHWNRTGFIMTPAGALNWSDSSAIKVGNTGGHTLGLDDFYNYFYDADQIFHCVRNSTYQAWREQHNAGGDLVSFSDMVELTFTTPWEIRVKLSTANKKDK